MPDSAYLDDAATLGRDIDRIAPLPSKSERVGTYGCCPVVGRLPWIAGAPPVAQCQHRVGPLGRDAFQRFCQLGQWYGWRSLERRRQMHGLS